MLMSALTNAKRYCATTAGRPEHELFRRYLANCEKNMANLRLKQGRLFQAAGGYVRSFRAYRDPRNLIPFA